MSLRALSQRAIFTLLVLIAGVMALYAPLAAANKRVALTDAERAWIKAHPRIVLGADASWTPYVVVGEGGVVRGLDADYIALLNNKLGTQIELRVGKWVDMVAAARARKIDGLATSAPLQQRRNHFLFSDSYFTTYKYIVIRKDADFTVRSPQDLAGRKVAVIRGNAFERKFLEKIGNIDIVESSSNRDHIKHLLEGKVDAALGGNNFPYLLSSDEKDQIKVAYLIKDRPLHLVYSIRKDWPMLVTILNKALASISEEEHQAIEQKWVALKYEAKINYALIWKIMAGAGLLLVLLLLWNWQTQRQKQTLQKAKQALQKSEEFHRTIFENAGVGIAYFGKDSKFIKANDHFLKFIGYSLDELKQMTPLDVTHPDDIAESKKFIQKEIAGDIDSFHMEKRFICKDGSIRWGIVNSNIVRDAKGNAIAWMGAIQDLTEHKCVEEALRESEEMWRSLTENSLDHILTLDRKLNIQFVNHTSPGLAIEQLIGTPLYKYVAEEQQEKIKGILETALTTGEPCSYETQFGAPTGQVIYYESLVAPRILSGEIVGLTVNARDITGHKQAEAALQENEQRLRLLIEQAEFILWSVDRELKFTSSIGGGLNTLGLQANEVVNANLDLYQFFQTDSADYPPIKAHFQALEGKPVTIETNWGGRYFQTQTTPQKDMAGNIIGCIGVAVDITARKQAEQALQRTEVLEQLATDSSLNDILTSLALNAEKHSPEALCSLMLLDEDGKHLRHGAAPSLPDFFTEAMDGVEIGHAVASCGEATYLGKRLIVEDIMSHPNWVAYRKLAKKANLRACWSEPVISSTGDILGNFAIYYSEPRAPTQSDLDFIQDSARLAAIAIEHKQAEEALKESEQKYRNVVENIGIGVSLISPDMEILALNKQMRQWFPEIDVTSKPLCYKSFNLPPRKTECSYCPTSKTFVDGQFHEAVTETPVGDKTRNFRIVSSPVKDEGGKIVAAIEVVEDITERQQAENALRSIVVGTSPVTGQDFFHTLVKHLASALGVHHVLVGELVARESDVIQTVAVWSGEDFTENFQYQLSGTPCENVIGKELCYYPQGIKGRFPDDPFLANMDAESYIGAPLFDSNEEPLGILAVLDNKPLKNLALVKSIVSIFADRAAVELERKHAEEKTQQLLVQNRQLTQRLFGLQEAERRHFAQELHDEMGQWLTAIQADAQAISNMTAQSEPQLHSSAKAVLANTHEVQKSVRGMIHQLRPSLLDSLGLKESLREHVTQWQSRYPDIKCHITCRGNLDELGENINITIYRIVQEALTNISKHAEARNVAIKLERQVNNNGSPDSLRLSIEDDGKGMNINKPNSGMGLSGMRERVLATGGHFFIDDSREKGVRLEAQFFINN
jgi:PAS domain S-box-containing protein